MALDRNKSIFFSNLARISEQVMKGKINEENAIDKLKGIFQEYYNAYELPLFDFVTNTSFEQLIAPLNFYFDKNSNTAGYYNISKNTNSVNVGTVFAESPLGDKLDPLTNTYINLFDVFSTISHESRHNRQAFSFLASLQQNHTLDLLHEMVVKIHPLLFELKKNLIKQNNPNLPAYVFNVKPTPQDAEIFASSFMQNLSKLKTKEDVIQYILNFITAPSINVLGDQIKFYIEKFATSAEKLATNIQILEKNKKTFSNALGENGKSISDAVRDFYSGNRISNQQIKEILENSYNITPTLWEERLLHLTKEDLEDITHVWYKENLMEVDARETESSSLRNLLADLQEYLGTTQSKEEQIILAPAVDAIKYQIELKRIIEEETFKQRKEYLPLVDQVINPEKILADMIATGREALKAEYTKEFLDKNSAFSGEFAGIKATKESRIVSSILNIVQKYNEVFHMSIKDFHLLLIQHGFIDAAEMLERCYQDENIGNLSLNADDYYNILMTKPITLNTLCYVNNLSIEQLSSVVEHFIQKGQLRYVEKIVQLCKDNSENPIDYIFKPDMIRTQNTISDDFLASWHAENCLSNLNKCRDTYSALKEYAFKLANTPLEELSFDEVDDALSSLHSIARTLGFEKYLKTNTPPPEYDQDAVNFFNIYNNLETIARIKLTDTYNRFDHTTLRYACPEDRLRFRSSPQDRRKYRIRVYGELENRRLEIKKDAYTKFSPEEAYTDEYDHE